MARMATMNATTEPNINVNRLLPWVSNEPRHADELINLETGGAKHSWHCQEE